MEDFIVSIPSLFLALIFASLFVWNIINRDNMIIRLKEWGIKHDSQNNYSGKFYSELCDIIHNIKNKNSPP